jgi:hypothetical protein
MALARASFAAGVLVFVALNGATPAYAHNVERVRRELLEQGYEQLEFSRIKPPFKLDACRDGQKFHLHVDYYGKVTEQTPIGSCGEDAAQVPAAEPPPVAAPAIEPPPEAAPASRGDKNSPDETQELCARYFPELGRTIRVPCE